jgi:DNA-binding CsgD family transcriptional regulator
MTRPSPDVVLRGREAELRSVAGLLRAATDGHGGALVFAGDAGTGKSALLASAVPQAQAEGFTVVEACGWQSETELGYAGLHRVLQGAGAAGLAADAAATMAATLDSRPDTPTEHLAVASAFLSLFLEAARRRPLLCCVDDVHLLDRPSLETFAFVARRIGSERVALLFAARGVAADLLPGVESVRPAELDDAASRALLADAVPHGLADDVAGVLTAAAAGNPQALTDLAESLTLEQRRGEAPPPQRLPYWSTLRRDFGLRLAGLPTDTRWLLLLLAADPDLDVGELIRATAASGMDIAALEPAERAGIVRATDSTIGFPQPLLRGIVYDDATASRRREAHQVLANTINPDRHRLRQLLHAASLVDGPDPEVAVRLAEAAEQDGVEHQIACRGLGRAAELIDDPVTAARYFVRAGQHAWAGGEPHRARMLVRRVWAADAARDHAEVPADVRAQAELLLAEIELWAGDTDLARHRMMALAREAGDRDLAMSAMASAAEGASQSGDYPNYPSLVTEVLALRRQDEGPDNAVIFEQFAGMAAMVNGRVAEATASFARAAALAPRLENASSLIHASIAALMLGDEHQAYRLAMRAAAVARATGDVTLVPRAMGFAAAAEFALGRYDAYKRILLEELPLARATGQDAITSRALAALALQAAVLGDAETSHARIAESRAYTEPVGASRRDALIDWALALLDLVAGRPAEALARLQGPLISDNGQGQFVLGVVATPLLVEAAVRSGNRAAAEHAMPLFQQWAVNTGQPIWLALAARCRGLLAEDDDTAEREFTEALRHHAAADSPFERARTELLFGQDLHRRRRHSAARDHLRRAVETFQQFDAAPWSELAASALRASGAHVEQPQTEAELALTPYQLQIARLAVAGATNREVAEKLFLSTRTVDHHMRQIFARLGIRSRTDLAKLIR